MQGRATPAQTELDWLVVGGGIHGVHLAVRLIGEGRVEPDRLRILDPAARLLARWRRCTAVTGMAYLRSPSVHNLGPRPSDLVSHARRRRRRESDLFAPPYERPALELFNEHCECVVDEFGLADLHVRAAARSCAVDCERALVTAEGGTELSARQVILAIGSGRPHRPAWARRRHPRVRHVFDRAFHRQAVRPGESVAVVGGGISAAQVALRLLDAGQRVSIVSRHPLREHQFDSDPGWLGPKKMARFQRERDFDRRRQMIDVARSRGSVPPDVHRALRRRIGERRIDWIQNSVRRAVISDDGVELIFANDARIAVDRVCLATGFERERPGGRMIDGLIASASLPCATCGYPIVDTNLRWHPRVQVSGPLAELELGPTARNIAGAQRAGDRIVA